MNITQGSMDVSTQAMIKNSLIFVFILYIITLVITAVFIIIKKKELDKLKEEILKMNDSKEKL